MHSNKPVWLNILKMKKLFYLLVLFFVANCTPSVSTSSSDSGTRVSSKSVTEPNKKRPKNIILMIGDGMGITQITAGYYMNKGKLNLIQFPFVGLHINYPKEDSTIITDSAAGATAFSIGEKTYNAAIGVDSLGNPKETILETAEKNGYATGLVATCNIQHATPASFIAHVKSRADYEPISLDFLKTDIDLFIGGGKQFFDNRKTDNRNLLTEFAAKGYQVTDWTKEDIDKVTINKKKFIYLTANNQPLTAEQGRDYLPFASKMACNFLQKSSQKGFFMMIEGSQIDWGGHAGNSNYIINEMLDFDKAVGEVLEFAKRDGNTLVIVTADHETGGYALIKGSKWGKVVGSFGDNKPDKNGSIYHTADFIPVFAFGPGAEAFTGVYQNTEIYHKMKAAFGF
jgi:alkaline phosphatase